MIAPPYPFIEINLSAKPDNMLLLHRDQDDISRETLGMATRPSSILYNEHRRKGELQTHKLGVFKIRFNLPKSPVVAPSLYAQDDEGIR